MDHLLRFLEITKFYYKVLRQETNCLQIFPPGGLRIWIFRMVPAKGGHDGSSLEINGHVQFHAAVRGDDIAIYPLANHPDKCPTA